jgi:NADPH2:quinone reductase
VKALVIDRFKTPGEVRDIPEPPLQAGAVLVRIAVAGVNPIDWKVREGQAGERTFPLVLGQDFAGAVERTGAGVEALKPGDRVFGFAREFGAFAERTLVPAGSPMSRIPDALGDDRAAALPTPALTALASLAALDVKPGSSLLIIGAAGAVGGAALQIAHHRGARVTAFVRPQQESDVRAFGADVVIASDQDARGAIRATTQEPFEAVLDLVSDAGKLKENAILVRPGGGLVTTIHVADGAWFSERGITATNIVLMDTPEYGVRGLDELAKMVVNGSLVVPVAGEKNLAEASELLDGMRAGQVSGKYVLRIDGT